MHGLSIAAETLRRTVYPPFASLWSFLRDVSGRRRRIRRAMDVTRCAADKRRQLEKWHESHDH